MNIVYDPKTNCAHAIPEGGGPRDAVVTVDSCMTRALHTAINEDVTKTRELWMINQNKEELA